MQQPPPLLPLGLDGGDPLELPRRRRPQVHARRHPGAVQDLRGPRPADIPGLRPEAVLPPGHVSASAREVVGVRPAGIALFGQTAGRRFIAGAWPNPCLFQGILISVLACLGILKLLFTRFWSLSRRLVNQLYNNQKIYKLKGLA